MNYRPVKLMIPLYKAEYLERQMKKCVVNLLIGSYSTIHMETDLHFFLEVSID